MKTNTKKVINILLSLALIFSMVTVFGGTAKAAGSLSNGAATIAGDTITILVDSSEAEEASLRIWIEGEEDDLDDVAYIEQPALVAGTNTIEAFVDGAVPNVYLRYAFLIRIVGASGSIDITCEVNADKTALIDKWNEVYNILSRSEEIDFEYVKDANFDALGALYVDVKDNVKDVPALTPAVLQAIEDLQNAIDALTFKQIEGKPVLSLAEIAIQQMSTLSRYGVYPLTIVTPPPGTQYLLEWSVNDPSYGVIDPESGVLYVLNKTGNIRITVTDIHPNGSGASASIILRIA